MKRFTKNIVKPGQLYKSRYGTMYVITSVNVIGCLDEVRYYAAYKLRESPARFGVSDRIMFERMELLSNGA